MKISKATTVIASLCIFIFSTTSHAIPHFPAGGTGNILQGKVQENDQHKTEVQLQVVGTNLVVDLQIGGVTLGQEIAINKVLQPGNLVQVSGGFDGDSDSGRSIFVVYGADQLDNLDGTKDFLPVTGTFLRSVESCQTPFKHNAEAEADADAKARVACGGNAVRVSNFTLSRTCHMRPYSDNLIARIDASATYKCTAW